MSESIVGQWWSPSDGSVGLPPETPLHETLRWIILQLHYGNAHPVLEDDGRADTLMIGRGAAPESTGKEFAGHMQRRSYAIQIVGIAAKARESGTEPEHLEMLETLRFAADENGVMNTDLHYALELTDVLANVRRRTFELVNLPLVGKASEGLIHLVREATRCHLFGLHKACAALCRAALERALSERLSEADRAAERSSYPRRGDLENMINIAGKRLLDRNLVSFAHGVRTKGNSVMHGQAADPTADSFSVLSDTRLIIERLFAAV